MFWGMVISSFIWAGLYLLTGIGIFEFFGLGALALACMFWPGHKGHDHARR